MGPTAAGAGVARAGHPPRGTLGARPKAPTTSPPRLIGCPPLDPVCNVLDVFVFVPDELLGTPPPSGRPAAPNAP
eukprot:15297994-Alexandrium_andersonii.AAC.1